MCLSSSNSIFFRKTANEGYSNAEMTDMLLLYRFCQGNGRGSVRVYRDIFPNRRIPNHQTFARIEKHLGERGTFVPIMVDYAMFAK